MKGAFGKSPLDMMKIATPIKALEEQTRRNMEMFQNAMRLFTPFPPGGAAPTAEPGQEGGNAGKARRPVRSSKEQIAAMQRKLDTMP